jgi:hypothetical protein
MGNDMVRVLSFGGTFVAVMRHEDSLIIGADSKVTASDGNVGYVQKIMPLGSRGFFSAIGSHVALGEFIDHEFVFSFHAASAAGDCFDGSRPILDVAEQWGKKAVAALENFGVAKSEEPFLMGIFGDTREGVPILLTSTISNEPDGAIGAYIERLDVPSGGRAYWNEHQTVQSFIAGTSPSAKAAAERYSAEVRIRSLEGPMRNALFMRLLVQDVVDNTTSPSIGGPPSVLVCNRAIGIRWFQ